MSTSDTSPNGRLILALSIVALLATSCGQSEAPPPPIRPVRVMEVMSTGGNRARTFSGVTQSGMESSASFRVPGKIIRLPVKVGNTLRAGDLIAELDRTDFELQVEQKQAARKQAQAAQRRAKSDYERVRQLYENESASRNDLDAARAAFESNTAQVESYDKQLQLVQQQLVYTRLVAPVDCSVAAVVVDVNENVTAGQQVAVLTSGGELEVQVAIPGVLISQIRDGAQVDVMLDAIRGQTYAAVVTEVGVQPVGTATTFPVTVRMATHDPNVRSGMAAEVVFQFESTEAGEYIFVPPVAVGEDRQGRFVFVVELGEGDRGICRRRAVEVGELTAAGLEIRSGLADGDLLVTAGVSRIEDGLEVRVPDGRDGAS